MRTSPWIILGTALILLILVVVMAIQNIRRDQRHMTEVLNARAIALIRAVEAGTRTGMSGTAWSGQQLQRLLEETALLPEVLYIALIAPDGTVLAHGDAAQVGLPLHPHRSPMPLTTDFEELRRPLVLADGRQAFEVLRPFRPLSPVRRPRAHGMDAMHRRRPMVPDTPVVHDSPQEGDRFIVVGLDMLPLKEMVSGAVSHTIAMSAGLLLLGFAGFVSLFWMNSYRAARRSLQDTSAFADEVVTHLPVGLIATDRNGRIAFFNAAAEGITGIPRHQAIGQLPGQVLPSALCDLIKQLDRVHTISEQEMTCDFAHAKAIPVSVGATRIVNTDKLLVGHAVIIRDLTELRRLQTEVRRQEKLAALGGLAAGVAHEIRNPLSSIKGLATYFADKFPAESPDRQLAHVMSQEVERLNRVISELLAFARPSDLRVRPWDLNALLHHTLQLVQQDAAAGRVDLKHDLTPGLCRARIDPDRMAQCLLNLYLNAIQAMPEGGRLTVASTPSDDHFLQVVIADTGCGIAPEDLAQIFNPYFTTKAKGTGLGLAIVHNIVEAHDGRIAVESIPGHGTRFVLTLPCAGGAQKEHNE